MVSQKKKKRNIEKKKKKRKEEANTVLLTKFVSRLLQVALNLFVTLSN